MSEDYVSEALASATDTRSIETGSGVLEGAGEVFRRDFGGGDALIIADEDTFEVAGRDVLRSIGGGETCILPARPMPYADYENVEKLVEWLKKHDGTPVSVGAGTINDLVKRAAHECGRPYMCVATAASMDGYTSFGASIKKDGRKQTLTCPAPRTVLADLDVLEGAPKWATASGYADLVCKVTAGADWMLSDALGTEEIHPVAWSLVHDHLRDWTADPTGLSNGSGRAMGDLITGLIMAGLAMQAAVSSRPASGAEHMFSHLWEMEGLGHDEEPPLSHGFKVGVGSIAVAALYERVLARDLTDLDVQSVCSLWPKWEEVEREVRAMHTAPGLDEYAVEESRAKYVDARGLEERLAHLRRIWPDLRERLRAQLMPASDLRELLREADCPVSPEDIGLGRDEFRATYYRARTIRRRYNVLDLATEAAILDECVEELFAPGGFWAEVGEGSR